MASRLGMNRADRRIETRDQNESGSSPEKSIGPKSYSYGELARVTGHFSLNNLIGRGGFGHVFKASLDGEIRAIKRLDFPDVQCEGGLEREIMVVKSVSHKNLVELVGYCIDGANRLLILKYFPNGSLRSKLHGSGDVLDWKKRMKIATGSAKGLEYLHEHCKPKIIHLDIKPDNILLDENFESKIADFGLAQFFTDGATHISKSSVMGTHVYEDPLTTKLGKYSDKSDIYSFGITLLELITGRKPIDNGIDIVTWANPLIQNALEGRYANFIDPKLQSFDNEEVYRTVSCVNSCLNQPLNSRPTMEKIRFVLEGKLPPEKLCDDELQRSIRDPKGSRSSPELNRSIILGPRQYSYQQLAKATNYFSSNDLIGEGGFGQVYRGLLDGESFAIKKLKNHPDLQSQENLKNEIMVVSSIRHRNLIELLGYCIEGANRLLVFKYFPNKSLSSQLHESDLDLDWKTRINIAKGCAKGLEYLHEHCEPPILHLDIKSDNILLDDDFKPKVKYFYNYWTHNTVEHQILLDYSVKSDVYSFGIMLLELITGRRPIEEDGFDVVKWAKSEIKSALRDKEFEEFVDSILQMFNDEEMYRMLFCIDVCINNPPKFRPSMKKILLALEGILPIDELCNEKGDNKLPRYPTLYKDPSPVKANNGTKMWRSTDEALFKGRFLVRNRSTSNKIWRSAEATNRLAEGVKRLDLSDSDEEEEEDSYEEEPLPDFLFFRPGKVVDEIVGANIEELQ
uniref:non-specific serine/threonine protein kinase n=1 Tax=Manihot esculenta TaxID=3983 RepID=A0A199UBH5_MANES